MARIFLTLALLALLLLATNLMIALTIGDFGAALRRYTRARDAWQQLEAAPETSAQQLQSGQQQYDAATSALNKQRQRFWPHVWLGIAASLVSLLVNCISVTYFIGTSRWCREVVEAYRMDTDWAERSLSLKRRTFPWALAGIVTILTILVLGAASDVYSPASRNPAAWVPWHTAAALLGIVVIAVSFAVQFFAVTANYRVINAVVAEARRMREEASGGDAPPTR